MPTPQNEVLTEKGNEAHYLFTVFTPSYNRADTLHRAYESLTAQTFRDFEWLIVDDGSSDQTQALVNEWQQTANFPIRYFWQPNQGKHIAFNYGVREAQGELFLILDSDDACSPHALERFFLYWSAIPETEQVQFSGAMALCMDVHGNIIGEQYPQDVMDCFPPEVWYKHKVTGDKCQFQKTKILMQFPFPFIENVKFIAEGVVWSEIGRHYKMRFFNEALFIVYRGPTGRSNQLTRSPISFCAMGCAMMHQTILNGEIGWLRYAPWLFFRSAVHYSRFSFHLRNGLGTQANGLHNVTALIMWIVALPLAYIIYLRDLRRP